MRPSLKTSLFLVLLGVAAAVPALAQPSPAVTEYPACPDPPPRLSQAELDAAHAVYLAGKAAYDEADYQKAVDNFQDAYRRDCSKVALLDYIARAYQARGNQAEAVHALETYLQRNPKAPDAEQVQRRIQNLKAQMATGSTATVSPTATATTTSTATATATATAAPTDTTTPPPPPAGGHTLPPWIVVGVGGAALVTGGILVGVGQSKVSQSKAGCPADLSQCVPRTVTPGANPQDRQSLNNSGTALSNVGVGLLVGGGVAIAGGLVWHFMEPTGAKKKKAALTPQVGPGYAGLSLSGQF